MLALHHALSEAVIKSKEKQAKERRKLKAKGDSDTVKVQVAEAVGEKGWRVNSPQVVYKTVEESKTEFKEPIAFQSDGFLHGEQKAKSKAPKHEYRLRAKPKQELLNRATDWRIQTDINYSEGGQTKSPPFPVADVATKRRPDLVVWSAKEKIMIWCELTSPWEENLSKNHFYKCRRYNQLAIDLRAKGWEVHPLCVEVGARGFIFEGAVDPRISAAQEFRKQSWRDMVKVFGLDKTANRKLQFAVQLTALHCSHAIFVHRYRREWEPKPLLDVSSWYGIK